MQVVGISDFNLGDIIRPEPQRLRMILSGIINYMKFREDQIKILAKMDKDVVSIAITQNKVCFDSKNFDN